MVIGSGSMPDLLTGLVITLGMALSTAPLAFVAIAAAKRQGMLAEHRRLLGIISEANRKGKPGFAGVLYIGGPSLYTLMSLALK